MAEAAGRLGDVRPVGRFPPLHRWWIGRGGRGSLVHRIRAIAMRTLRVRGLAAALGAFLLGCAMLAGAAQPAKKNQNPAWSELTAEQRQILAPLSGEWDTLEPVRKKKWLGIAKRYPKMTPIGQKRTQTRMQKWVNLSPEERREAREKYRSLNKLPPEQRQDLDKRWAEYQSLPPAERQKVAPPPSDRRSAKRKRTRTPGPSGATTESYREW